MTNAHCNSIQIDLMRHGEPEGGLRFRGKLDDPLTQIGLQQMHDVLSNFTQPPWSTVYTSPLKRCAVFSEKIEATHGIPCLIEPHLSEIDFGAWEGKTAAQIYEQDNVSLTQFWSDPKRFHPPDGEALITFQKRVLHALNTIINKHTNESVLLVVHSGVIKIIVAHALGMPLNNVYRLKIDFAHLAKLHYFYDSKSFLLKAFNTKKFTNAE